MVNECGAVSAAQQQPVIQRKLAPPAISGEMFTRDRLNRRITDLLKDHRVVTVCAAAGSGKTTGVAMAVRTLDRVVAWLSLDGTETAPGRLLKYLESAAACHLPHIPPAASQALANGIPPVEAAGLLAESWAGSGLLLVCDNVEKVTADTDALAILSALARYLPAGIGMLLISDSEVVLEIDPADPDTSVGEIDHDILNLNVDEAGQALGGLGIPDQEIADLLAQTHGWLAGTRFAVAQRRSLDNAGNRTADRLTAKVLAPLSQSARSFLTRTSLLAEVTVEFAIALEEPDAAQLMVQLTTTRLPATWSADRKRLILYPLFREWLAARLAGSEDAETIRRLRSNYAEVLAQNGHPVEAVDTLLSLGETERAWRQAALALPNMVARMDFTSATRWLDDLVAIEKTPTPEVGMIVLRGSFAMEQSGRGNRLLERFGHDWLPGPDSPYFEEALLLAAWCRWHDGRLTEARVLADRLPTGRARDAAENLLALSEGGAPPFPEFSSTPSDTIDALLMRIGYFRGRLRELDRPTGPNSGPGSLGVPWVIAGLRATGRIHEAMQIYEVLRSGWQPPWLHAFDAVDLMIDLGRRDEAWTAQNRGHQLIAGTGSRVYRIFGYLNEAKLQLRLHQDTEAARRALAEAESGGADNHAFSRELCQLWRGLCHLLDNRNDEALTELEACVESMRLGDRRLELATVATYLAEAYWRLGKEDASDEAAELALREASARGSQHLLLNALADVPAVAVRAADASPNRQSRWHELTALLSGDSQVQLSARAPRLVLEEFGEATLTLDGMPANPRLSKSIELMSYLLAARREVTREELLGALFDSRNDAADSSYLRQALYRLRAVLPDELAPQQNGNRFAFPHPELVCGTSQIVLDGLTQADRQDDEIRLRTMIEALTRANRGQYLAALSGPWVEQRRFEVGARLTDGRIDAAKLAFRLSRYREARLMVDEVLRVSPDREQAWQLAISLAHASGRDDTVLALYQRYMAAMRDLGVAPSAEVHRLVTRLRR
ncbi:Serine/threonine-protein kinase PknK [Mycolicibacterium chlorophenolicum]|uniref:Serine/threonine-protein kinase PknK n=1 Tax=Mycolicibacterium chlorophenolicum TaxID=37916 RepID=A0A0J6WJY0_9MYCO|nr:Serine/threonine-protein kinase PknK [Mycolicibacterium chlorophenolicum]